MKKVQDIPLKQIQRDESTQARVRTDDDVAGEYSEILEALAEPVVFFDGKHYWLGDGWHTVRGYELKRKKMVRCEVRKGTRLDAIVYAAGANTKHGLRRTNADKRRAVWLLLQYCPDWSNRQIAEHACVHHQTVANVMAQETESGENSQTIEVENQVQKNGALVDRLTPAQRAVYDAMSPNQQEEMFEESKTDALDDRLNAAEVVIFRVQKRLGDDAFGKTIRDDLKLFLASMRECVGWKEVKQTVRDEPFRDRTLIDFDRLRKLDADMPGQRQRTPILDRLVSKVKAE
jgi:hypothetical protein